jgi:Mce-associated membrane protein
MNPTLYDILGVPPSASPEDITRAWRDASQRFEPGAGGTPAQFRLFNEAAETLLDPDRRRAYDAEHGLGTWEEAAPVLTATTGPAASPATAGTPLTHEPPSSGRFGRRGPTEATTGAPGAVQATTGLAAPSRRVVAALGALALLLTAIAAVLGLLVWNLLDVREQDAVDEASRAAPAAAERASAAILAYSYKSLDADEEAAAGYMTPAYAKQYSDTFDRLVRPNAAKIKATVEADVKASGITRAQSDRVNVLLYVDQTTTSTANSGTPQVALNRVQLSMVRRDGRWLVNDITSY